MKKSILIITLSSLLFACGEGKEEQIETESQKTAFENIKNKEIEEQKLAEEEKIRLAKEAEEKRLAEEAAKDVFKKYNFKTKVKNEELQKIIDTTIKDYELLVDDIRSQIEKAKEESIKNRKENIAEIEIGLKEQKELFENNCKKIDASNKISCNEIGSNIANLETKINKIEISINNEIKKFDAIKENELKEYQTALKTNVSKLISQDR